MYASIRGHPARRSQRYGQLGIIDPVSIGSAATGAIKAVTGTIGKIFGSNKANEVADHYRWNESAYQLAMAGPAPNTDIAVKYLGMRAGVLPGTTLPDIGFLDERVAAGKTMGPWQHAESRQHAKQLYDSARAPRPGGGGGGGGGSGGLPVTQAGFGGMLPLLLLGGLAFTMKGRRR